MASFVFVEFTDRDLNALFSGISWAIEGETLKRCVHLTIRGPYRGSVGKATIQACKRRLVGSVFSIGGVGRFSNPGEEVVFLRVSNPALRSLWWKPDFAIAEHGFNPHISVYRGPDACLATAICRFFEHERLALLCAEFQVVTTVTKQPDLFRPPVPVSRRGLSLRIGGAVRDNMAARLEVVVGRHQRRQHANR